MLLPKGWRRAHGPGMQAPMGITHVEGRVRRADGIGPELPVTLLVDSGEMLGLVLHPPSRRLVPLRLLLARMAAAA